MEKITSLSSKLKSFALVSLFTCGSLFFTLEHLSAADRYWIATSTANWNSTANWSTTSTGSGGSSVPGSSDRAYFTSSRNGNCNINATVNVYGISISGYTGTITQTSTYTITVGAYDWIQSSGTFTGGSGYIDINDDYTLSGGTFTSTSGTLYLTGCWTHTSGGTFTHNSGTVEFDGSGAETFSVNSSETFYNMTVNKSNSLSIASGDIPIITNTLTLTNGYVNYSTTAAYMDARGNVSVGSGWDGGSEPLKFTGSTAIQTFYGYYSDRFDADITINKSAGEVKLTAALTMNGSGQDLYLTAGTLNMNGQTLTINHISAVNTLTVNGSATISGSGTILTHDFVQTTGTLTVPDGVTLRTYDDFILSNGTFNWGSGTVDVDDDFTFSGGTFNAPSSTMYVGGSWNNSGGTFNDNSGEVIFDGSSSEYINVITSETFCDLTVNKENSISVSSNDIIITTGTLTLTNGYVNYSTTAAYMDARGNVSIGSGWDGGSEPLKFTGSASVQTFYSYYSDRFDADITIDKSAGEVRLTSAFTLDGQSQDLYLTDGTLNVNGQTLTINYTSSANTLTVNGSATISGSGTIITHDFVQTTGILTVPDGVTLRTYDDFIQSGGTFNWGSGTVDVDDDFTFSSGTFNAPSSSLTIGGSYSNSGGTFTHNSGEVIFDGDGSENISVVTSETFNDLTINKNNALTVASNDIIITEGTLTLTNGYVNYTGTIKYLEARGNVSISTSFDGGSEPLRFTGSAATQTFYGQSTDKFNADITIDKSAGEVQLTSNFTLDGENQDLYLTAGTLNMNSKTLTIHNASYANTLTINGTASIKNAGTITAYRYSQGSGALTFTGTADANLALYDDFTMTGGSFTGGSGTVNVDDDMTLSGGTFNAPSTFLYVEGNFVVETGATYNPNNGTISFDGDQHTYVNVNSSETFYNMKMDKSSATYWTYVYNPDILITTGTLTLNNGCLGTYLGTGTIQAQGDVDVESNFDGGNATVLLEFTGTANQNFDLTNATSYFDADMKINKTGGEVTLLSTLTMNCQDQDLYMQAGTLNLNGQAVTVNYSNQTGYLYAQTSTSVIAGSGSITALDYSQSNGTISFSGTANLIINDDFSQSGGTFTGGSGYVNVDDDFSLTGGTFNAPTGTLYVEGNFTVSSGPTFNHSNGTVEYDGDQDTYVNINSSETFYNLKANKSGSYYELYVYSPDVLITEGTLTFNDGTFYGYNGSSAIVKPQGDVDVEANFDGGNAGITLEFSGSADQDFDLTSATSYFDADIKINKTGGEVTLLSALTMNCQDQDLYMQAGTLNLNGQTVTVNYSNQTGSLYPQTSTSVIAGSGSISAYKYSQSNGAISLSGAATLSFVDDFTISGGTFTGGSGSLNVDDDFTLSGGTFTAPSGIFYQEGNFTHSGGTFTHNSGTVYFDGDQDSYANLPTSTTFCNVTNNKSSSTYELYIYTGDFMITTGTLSLQNGCVYGYNGTGTLQAQGNVDVESSLDGSYSNLLLKFAGSANQNFDLTGATSLFDADIKVNKSGGQVNLLSGLTANYSNQDLILEEGTFDLNGQALAVNGSGSTFVVESGGNLQMLGNESPTTPTLNSGSIVTYDGNSTYTIEDRSYNTLTIAGGANGVFKLPNNLSGISTVTISSGTLYLDGYNLSATTLSNEGTLKLKGTETLSFTNMDVNSGTVEYAGTNTATTYTIKDFGSTDYNNLIINDQNINKATFQLGAAMNIAGTLNVSSGTFSANGQTTSIAGLCTVDGGTYTASTATQTANGGFTISSGTFTGSSGALDINGDFTQSGGTFTAPTGTNTISGDFAYTSGTFTHNNGTVTFDGSTQALSGAAPFNNLTISGSETKTAGSNLTIAGNLSVSAGTLDLDSYTANRGTSGGTMTVSNGATLKMGGTGTIPANYSTHSIGSTSTIEYDGSTQTVGSLNSSQDYGHLTISGSGTKTLAANTTVGGTLTCNSGTNLTVDAGEELTVDGTITVNGSESLILKSNSSGSTASLLDGGTYSGSGSVKFERYFTEDKWHYFTPVIQNTSSNSFWNAAMYKYNAAESSWDPIGPGVTLDKMTGYDVYYQDNTTVTTSGTPYTGSHSINLDITSNGYNFVGNPYLSAIDWDAGSGWTKSDVDNAIYVWDPTSAAISSYVNSIGTNGGSKYIPPSQGFFVTVANGGPYSLASNNNVRVHNSVSFRNEDSPDNTLKLSLADDVSSDETAIYFADHATPLFDGQYDAYKMDEGNPARTTIYSKTSDGEDLSINGLPALHHDRSIPVYLASGSAGHKVLSVSGLESFDADVDIFLEDLKLDRVVDMKNGDYSFLYSPYDEKKRFVLHFTLPAVITSSQIQEINDGNEINTLNSFISAGELIIDLTKTEDTRARLYVYNMQGKLIMNKEFNSHGLEKVKLQGKAGYYLLKIVSGDQIYTKKVLKSNVQ